MHIFLIDFNQSKKLWWETNSSTLKVFIVGSLVQTKHSPNVDRFHPTRAQQDKSLKSGTVGVQSISIL